MKAAACSHIWWPGIDSDIKSMWVQAVFQNQKGSTSSTTFAVVMAYSSMAAHYYFIIVDAHSKWPEVIGPMKTTTAEATVNAMRNIFARYSLPKKIISENGPHFSLLSERNF